MIKPSSSNRKSGWIPLRLKRLPVSLNLDGRVPLTTLILGVSLLAIMAVSTASGEYPIPIVDVVRTVLGLETGNLDHTLVIETFRLPRIVMAALVGMALALSGSIMQGVTRNDLADPGILGVSSGAGVLVVGHVITAPRTAPGTMSLLAFVGAFTAVGLIYLLAWKGGSSSIRLILVGVGISSVGAALINFLIIRGDIHFAQSALVWLAGSVFGSDWEQVRILLLWLLPLGLGTLFLARPLNALHLGDDIALGLGTRVELSRLVLVIAATGLAAASVSVAGTIAFVGFVAPHISRRLVGPSHQGLLLTAALVGAVLLVLSDLVSRTLIAPNEIPLGVTTSIIGAPYFAYLLYKKGR